MPALRYQTSHWIAVRWDGATLEAKWSDWGDWTAIPLGADTSVIGETRLKRNGGGNSTDYAHYAALDMRTGSMSDADHQALVDSWAALWGAWS